MNKKRIYRLICVIAVILFSTLITGCSTPQERSGYSAIPFNAQEPSEIRPFGGRF
jgi:hypothetical protein